MAEQGTKENKSETAKREEEVIAFWRENKTFERSLEKDAPKGEFVFYDGPPFATGLPHHGSLLSSIIKDVIPRYKTMRGYRVRRRWGWDTHGLPIENLVEKELGLKTKKDILDIGIAKFNETARSMVLRYVHDWKQYVERVGRWWTTRIRTRRWTIRTSNLSGGRSSNCGQGIIVRRPQGLNVLPARRNAARESGIAADNTYKDITEEAVTVKFKLRAGQKIDNWTVDDNTYLLAWTTTPWTLPGNVALAVGPEISYAVSKKGDEHFVTSENLVPAGAEVVKKVSASDLIGVAYEPLFDIKLMQTETSHKVYAADFVTTGEGTGIVHTAVMYGEDDYALGAREKLPMVQMLTANGSYNDVAPEFIRGKYIKDAEKDIKRDLEARGLLFERKTIRTRIRIAGVAAHRSSTTPFRRGSSISRK